MGCSHKTYV